MSKAYVYKLVTVGDPGVGKSSLINRFVENKFKIEYQPTLGANIVIKDVQLENILIRLLIFDIAGQKRWSEVRKLYYKGAQAAIIVYDVTRPMTFKSISDWCKDLTENAELVSKVLIANKIDLIDEIKISSEEGNNLAQELNCPIFETSALDGTKVPEAFNYISMDLFEKTTDIQSKAQFKLKEKKISKRKKIH